MKCKKWMIITLLLCLTCALLNSAVTAGSKLADAKEYSWYYVPVPDNKQPKFDISTEDLKHYGAYAIGSPDDKVLYLTFDFGFENGNVKKCLDILNSNGVKGAFFILDHVIKANTGLIKEIAETGHIIGNHTMKHKNMRNVKDFAEYEKELRGLEKIYEEATGYKMSHYFRPPKGEFTKQNLEYNQKLGYKTIFWSFAYVDWDREKQPGKEAAFDQITNYYHNGCIILLHAVSESNAQALGDAIDYIRGKGYEFKSLHELPSY
jgi:peptidoglycan-N-acetylmuramic acid deacetylase